MSETSPEQKKPSLTAQTRVMDLLAVRDHSEQELRTKLAAKFSEAEIETAIQMALDKKWLPDPQVLAERYADELHRRGKGILAINLKLQEKGLPPVTSNDEVELEKALSLAHTKHSPNAELDQSARERIGRFLISRGFDSSIVEKVIYEKL